MTTGTEIALWPRLTVVYHANDTRSEIAVVFPPTAAEPFTAGLTLRVFDESQEESPSYIAALKLSWNALTAKVEKAPRGAIFGCSPENDPPSLAHVLMDFMCLMNAAGYLGGVTTAENFGEDQQSWTFVLSDAGREWLIDRRANCGQRNVFVNP